MRPLRPVFAVLLGVGLGCADASSEPMRDAALGLCVAHADCDDGVFCNGPETCDPGAPGADPMGCVLGVRPCAEDLLCSEEDAACTSPCGAVPDADGDGALAIGCGGNDCDDADPNRFPGNPEVCDPEGRDEDCDPSTFGAMDRDGDGEDDAACCNTGRDGARRCGSDCNDRRRDVRAGLFEICDTLDNDCDGLVDEDRAVDGFADRDFDLHGDPGAPLRACPGTPGFSPLDDDCDDADPARHRAQVEVCDGIDNDCDGVADESPTAVTWYRDDDGDGFGSAASGTTISCVPPAGHSLRSSDCDDGDRAVSPAAAERCNGRDDDCDGLANAVVAGDDLEDDDADGFADAACGGPDCDDANASVGPGVPELCDGLDNDCDGVSDGADASVSWFLDLDGDGFGDEAAMPVTACEPVEARVPRGGDCNDGDAAIRPDAVDACDGVDQDCDGAIDEAAPRLAYYADGDGDGWGDGVATLACAPPAGLVDRPADCDDLDPAANPGATEVCSGTDTDCDGSVDESADGVWFVDADGDGFGIAGTEVMSCDPGPGFAPIAGDCRDGDDSVFPMAEERCDRVDNDCDGTVDEGADAFCAFTTGTGTCGGEGLCEIAGCATGRADCDGAFPSGCEVDTTADAQHCGACFAPCAIGDTCGRVVASTCDESPVVQLSLGLAHTIGLRGTGGTLSFGRNDSGELANGSRADSNVPVAQPLLPPLSQVDGGAFTSVGLTTGGQAWVWGWPGQGLHGTTAGPFIRNGRPVAGLPSLGVDDVSIGFEHACAVVAETDAGGAAIHSVYCWGRNNFGQLGHGTLADVILPPARVPGITDARAVHAQSRGTCVLRDDPVDGVRVSCWGDNGGGELGRGATGMPTLGVADVIALPTGILELVDGWGPRSCVRTASLELWCWGQGILGDGGTAGSSTPQRVSVTSVLEADFGVSLTGIRTVGCVRRPGAGPGLEEVWCWGDTEEFGARGLPEPDVLVPRRVGTLTGVTHVGASPQHGCASLDDGSLHCWGLDDNGQVGQGLPFTTIRAGVGAVSGLP